MLKYELDSLEGLDENTKKLYAEKDGKFILSVEGVPAGKEPDVSGLVAKNEQLLAELKQFKGKAREEEEAKRKAEEDAAKKKGDIEALEKSWQAKLDEANSENKKQIEALQASLDGLLVSDAAQKIASEIGLKGSESLLIPHITQRLAAEERDGRHVTVVKDLEGKASALTLDDLKKEFINNPAFAPVVVGTRANGGGATGGLGAVGDGTKKPEEMGESERVALYKDNPEQFKQLFKLGG